MSRTSTLRNMLETYQEKLTCFETCQIKYVEKDSHVLKHVKKDLHVLKQDMPFERKISKYL
jgi:GTP:adenosylcobinamide-phosphate guanylyltransferase